MDEENFLWSGPYDVDAIVANDGDEFLANADADAQGGENFYGQNQSLAGDGGWWDDNYPGQTVQNPNAVTENVFDPRQEVQESVFNPAAAEPNPYLGLTPDQLKALGNADPTDPYIRARLGISQLPDSPLSSLPSTSNFFNSIKDVATSATTTVQKAVSALTSKTSAANPYPAAGIARSVPAVTQAASPTQDAFGLNILSAAETQQLTRNINPAFINSLVDPNTPTATGTGTAVNTSATPVYTPSPYTETRQTAIDAARLNAQSEVPNQYLTNIDQAEKNIVQGQAYIDKANQAIQTGQENIVKAESIIAQNNTELADDNLPDARRAELEANNAFNTKVIAENKENITANQEYITQTQANIQFNNESINANAAAYRDTNGPSNTTVVPNNIDPNVPVRDTVATGVNNPTTSATPVNAQDGQAFGPALPDGNGGFVDAAGNPVDANGVPIFPVPRATYPPSAVNDPNVTTAATATTTPFFGGNPDAEAEAAAAAQVGRQLAQQQAVTAAQRRVVNNSDWRVRLSLAPGATYLYNAPTGQNGVGPGILWPLRQTDGVIFPYTPKITVPYKADYEATALTHSNYKGYFYKSSSADAVQLNAIFTAQDTNEAQYLLAVIHFFRSVTKMFYGQDPNRGAPPPLVYLTGLGEFQFAQHPCVVSNFTYSLPSDVDYIRARSININGTDLLTRRDKQSLPTNPISGAVARLQNLFSSQGINKGAVFYPPPVPNLGENQPTYVPTKMEIDLTLLPMQSRQQVSRVFDNRQYNNGAQLKGGFW